MSTPNEQANQWKQWLADQQTSGLSIAAWCRKNNIADHRFYYWRDKLSDNTSLNRSAFTEVKQNLQEEGIERDAQFVVEYGKIRIRFNQPFNNTLFKACLQTLKEIMC